MLVLTSFLLYISLQLNLSLVLYVGIDSSNTRTTQATVEWTLSGTEGGTSGDTMTDGYLATDATTYGNDFGADTMGMDCGDFDDCSAYASADAFAIF